MRKIPLATISFVKPTDGTTTAVPYVELLHGVLFFTDPSRGQTTADIVTGLRVWSVIDKARDGDAVNLEDADYAILAQRLETFTWGMLATWAPEECGKFIDAVRNAETVDPNAPPTVGIS